MFWWNWNEQSKSSINSLKWDMRQQSFMKIKIIPLALLQIAASSTAHSAQFGGFFCLCTTGPPKGLMVWFWFLWKFVVYCLPSMNFISVCFAHFNFIKTSSNILWPIYHVGHYSTYVPTSNMYEVCTGWTYYIDNLLLYKMAHWFKLER